jgi:AcrR family transcriptional regulator
MDRRRQKTRLAVYQAFTGLLEKKTYSAITVQEMIDEADLGRRTFYSHFETKDDLLKALCTEIFEHVFSEELTKEKTHDFSAAGRDLRAEITHILYHLQDSRRYIRGILSCESGELFMRFFKQYLSDVFADVLDPGLRDVPRDYMLNHLVCDFAETVRWWMRNDGYTPEQISGFFLATTPFAGH